MFVFIDCKREEISNSKEIAVSTCLAASLKAEHTSPRQPVKRQPSSNASSTPPK